MHTEPAPHGLVASQFRLQYPLMYPVFTPPTLCGMQNAFDGGWHWKLSVQAEPMARPVPASGRKPASGVVVGVGKIQHALKPPVGNE